MLLVSLQEPPFVFRTPYGYSGYTLDVLERISRRLNFTYEIREPEDGQYGTQQDGRNWSGMIGELQRGVRAD